MKDKKISKGFTLIELIAVLVILAVIALIVTPLVLNVVRKAKDSANKRSVDAYGKSIELAVAAYLMEKGDFPTSVDQLTIEYSGKEVVCGVSLLNEDSSVYLSECTVGGKEVKDSNTDDGWYHYGKSSAIVYQSYSIGDIVTYNGINFYVIADSDEQTDSITMLKAEPLSVDEVNTYGVGHIDKYAEYPGIDNTGALSAYYSSETCGFPDGKEEPPVAIGCINDYDKSDVKYIVDKWSDEVLVKTDLKEDSLGYKVRLITINELQEYLGYEYYPGTGGNAKYYKTDVTPEWVYNHGSYFTMSAVQDSVVSVWYVLDSSVYSIAVYGRKFNKNTIRPVVTIKKSAI